MNICRVCAIENGIERGKKWSAIGTCELCGEHHVLFPARVPMSDDKPKVTQTVGGTITTEGGKIVNAWCANCKRGGLPSKRGGGLYCSCGHRIASADEAMDSIR